MAQSRSKLTAGERTSDFFTRLVRSWRFVIFQLGFIIVWIILNGTKVVHFDPFPYDMLKLILTIEASFIGSMILMNQHRQSNADRKIAYKEYVINWGLKKEVDKMLPMVEDDHGKMVEVLDILKKDKATNDK